MRDIIIVVLGIVGTVLAKFFWFNAGENIAWDMFWSTVSFSSLSWDYLKMIVSTTPYLDHVVFKSFVGFFLGGIIGIVFTRLAKIK